MPRSLTKKVIHQVFPIHDQAAMQQLQKAWIQTFWARQPIGIVQLPTLKYLYTKTAKGIERYNIILLISGGICDYFGVKIALYFAWLGHYTTALFIPAIVGIVFWVSQIIFIFIKIRIKQNSSLTFSVF